MIVKPSHLTKDQENTVNDNDDHHYDHDRVHH